MYESYLWKVIYPLHLRVSGIQIMWNLQGTLGNERFWGQIIKNLKKVTDKVA
jgi:hypothetical protein